MPHKVPGRRTRSPPIWGWVHCSPKTSSRTYPSPAAWMKGRWGKTVNSEKRRKLWPEGELPERNAESLKFPKRNDEIPEEDGNNQFSHQCFPAFPNHPQNCARNFLSESNIRLMLLLHFETSGNYSILEVQIPEHSLKGGSPCDPRLCSRLRKHSPYDAPNRLLTYQQYIP